MRARVLDADGNPVFNRDMWLLAIGDRRRELSLIDIWIAYGQRYDVEHFYHYGKQRLLMSAYQTPVVEHEENWWQIVQLAYVQLWLARSLAETLPCPWERYLSQLQSGCAPPATVQRNFERIIAKHALGAFERAGHLLNFPNPGVIRLDALKAINHPPDPANQSSKRADPASNSHFQDYSTTSALPGFVLDVQSPIVHNSFKESIV